MSKLRGKVAVVTGASKGIGAGGRQGTGGGRRCRRGQLRVEPGPAPWRWSTPSPRPAVGPLRSRATSSKAADAGAIIDAAITAFGRLDILVNNAGVYEWAALGDITEAQYRWMFDTNVPGTVARHSGGGQNMWAKAPA